MLRITDYEWWNDPKWHPSPQTETDDDGIVKDGQIVRVPLIMMDGDPRRKALDALRADAAQRSVDEAYDNYEKRITAAWRNAPSLPRAASDGRQQRDVAHPPPISSNSEDARERAYREYAERICNAWRSPR
jgi:hypothetical protein